MASLDEDTQNKNKEESEKTTWIDFILILILINLGLVVVATLLASITVKGYVGQLIPLITLTGIVLFADILISLLISAAIPAMIKRLSNWSEDKESGWIAGIFLVTITVSILGSIALIYVLVLPEFPLLQDPFSLGDYHLMLRVIYSLWWFIGFVASVLVLVSLIAFS